MAGSKFSPRLESLDTRLCMSATGAEVMAVDMFKPGEEAGLIGLLRVGDEKGAADDFLVNNEKTAAVDRTIGESGWDVKPGEERGAAVDYGLLLPAVRVEDGIGGPYVGGAGWDVKP